MYVEGSEQQLTKNYENYENYILKISVKSTHQIGQSTHQIGQSTHQKTILHTFLNF